MNKKNILISISVVAIIAIIWVAYAHLISTTKIATLNFPDFSVEKFIRSNNNDFISIESIKLDEVEKIKNYDIVLVRVHGSSMDSTHLKAIKDAIKNGVTIYATESSNKEINTLSGQELKYISTLFDNGSVKNYQSAFNYLRAKKDGKIAFNKPYYEPIQVPKDFYFHLGDDNFFSNYADYQKFYEQSGKFKADAPKIALLLGNINLQNSNEEHIEALISGLENKGLNVYPISSFGMKKLKLVKDVNPDLIIYNPHGRLVMGGAEQGEALLKELNVPIIAPLTVSELHDKWLKSKQGFAAGGLMSMSIVLPELDGAIAPFAIAAQFERNGYNIFDSIPHHTSKFCNIVKNFTELQVKSNKDKKVAIYYYKGAGKGALGAADIEGVESLYNTLLHLKNSGYTVNGLPNSSKELEALIQKQGSVLGSYALGAYDKFLKEGNPELIDAETFNSWTAESFPQEMADDMKKQYGEFPGKYMTYEKDGKKYISVARIEFGNVVILPQPMAAEGEDVETITHGVAGAPAYPYVASYLYTRLGFKADAMIHFGTHGSLEFIPGKQVALSDYDWTDALVGDMPHFYIYTINNIGEGIIAKRRSYATLVDHLTAPFMQGELYGNFDRLKSLVHKFEQIDEGEVKTEYRRSIAKLAKKENIFSTLGIDSTKLLDNASIEKIHIYIEEIDGAKVTDGLYTLGKQYTTEEANNTIKMMMIDPIKYSLASIDVAHGKIDAKKLDNIAYISHKYGNKAKAIINRAIRGENANIIINSIISKKDLEHLFKYEALENAKAKAKANMMKGMMAAFDAPQKPLEKFLDDNGNIIGKDGKPELPKGGGCPFGGDKMAGGDMSKMPDHVKKMLAEKAKTDSAAGKKQMPKAEKKPSMMSSMASSKSLSAKDENKVDELAVALKAFKDAIEMIHSKKQELLASTKAEQDALLNALNGGHILPSSAGDPIVNPAAITTGRNFYSVNPEVCPTEPAWKVGKRLAENLLAQELTVNGKYPEKVSFTMWSTDFISSEGASVAQALWLLGVEPMRDGFGYIRSLRVVPIEQLGRPRIDVVVQTSGQLRDIAASRLSLINRAIAMAAEANDGEEVNYIAKGFKDAEKLLLEKGFSPADARKYSRERIFGGAGGNYGTGIMGKVEDSENWETQDEIAKQYLKNMSGIYTDNGSENWGEVTEGVFEAALLNTSVVVQPRSSNTWGPLSLDHVYEFMGGLSAAVQHVTGNDPTAYFNDFRNANRAKVQGLKEAIGVETSSTVFNPKYIGEKLKGGASSYSSFSETVRNTFGWNAMKPSAIDQHIWNEFHNVYVKDKYNLNIEKQFKEKNPYALQEVSAVMLEAARKDMWKATPEQIKELSELHSRLVIEHEAGCSGFICDNAKLKEFIAANTDKADDYKAAISDAREVKLEQQQADNSVVLKKEEQTQEQSKQQVQAQQNETDYTIFYVVGGLLVILIIWGVARRKKD